MYKLFMALLFFSLSASAQPKTDSFLVKLLQSNNHPVFQRVLQNPDQFRVQIIYTQINRDKHNKPSFSNYYFHVDPNCYFNPASTVKLPLALLSLEKINRLHQAGLTKYTPVLFDSAYNRQTTEYTDSTSESGFPSIAHFIKKAFLVSDNDAYSRMYEFVGQQNINRWLHKKGYTDVRITHRFVPMSALENRHTNPIRFLRPDGSLLFAQPPAFNTDSFDFSHAVRLGKGYINSNDSLVNGPFDFTYKNNISLQDLQQILQSVLFPVSVCSQQRFLLTEDDRHFLYQYLSQFPGETNFPKYDTTSYYDNYVKFLFRDSAEHHLPKGIRVFNKVGWAYGFMTDVSYVADFSNGVEFMLSATVYVNSDGIINDSKYDYDAIGHPFLYQLGQTIYYYELNRKRKFAPNLSRFKIQYEQRKDDARPLIKEVEN
ncbi:MAG: serine hydrolase [Bacteroidota bacterium]|nr:serine hydrolase [Bacteroidota bacterium]